MSTTLTLDQGAEGLIENRRNIPFETDEGIAARAAIGVIVLGSDNTIEYEFRRLIDLPGVAFFESRIANDPTITPETLKAMQAGLEEAAGVILPGVPLDVMAYGCTSGAMMIGDEKVAAQIHKARPGIACTNPMVAACAAFEALGCRRIALLTPYLDEINQAMRARILEGGFEVPVMGSFNEPDDNRVARISAASLRAAAVDLGSSDQVDAVFVSCTSIRLADGIEELEAELGKPVTSSNHAVAWHCLRLAGIQDKRDGCGQLFRV